MPTTISAKSNLHKATPPSMQQTTAIRHTLLGLYSIIPPTATQVPKNAELALLAGKINVRLISSGLQGEIFYVKGNVLE